MKSILLVGQAGEEKGSISVMLRKKGFHVIEVADDASVKAALISAMAVDLVVAAAGERGQLCNLQAMLGRRIPVIFLSDSAGKCRDCVSNNHRSHGHSSERRSAGKFDVLELDRRIRLALNVRFTEPGNIKYKVA
jgi:hypothetical protein